MYLGLKTLDVIQETCRLIYDRHKILIEPYSIPVDHPSIYSLLNDGHSTLIFQFDGTAAAYIPKIKPENINEISDLTSLNP